MVRENRFLIQGYDIVVFDCDSTLTAVEGIDLLAQKSGKYEQISVLTEQAMNGRINFEDVFSRRLDAIKPHRTDLEWLGQQYIEHRIRGTENVVRNLLNLGKKVYIVRYKVGKLGYERDKPAS